MVCFFAVAQNPSSSEKTLDAPLIDAINQALKWLHVDQSTVTKQSTLADLAKLLVSEWQQKSQVIIEVRAKRETKESASATVIFMHGLGDTGNGWAENFELMAEKLPHVRFLFPTALQLPVTFNGRKMPAWYDIVSLDERNYDSAPFIEYSRTFVHCLIYLETRALPSQRIVLGGFSQGGALSLFAAHTHALQLGGVMSLSGYIPERRMLAKHLADANRATPVLMCHGDSDTIVPMRAATVSHDFLKQQKGNLGACDLKVYLGMGHSSCKQEMDDVQEFLTCTLAQPPPHSPDL